ncbi:phosphoenolpyruvate synthase [Cladochytrium replicatum]|nr:phosphoenolpyruvate synthase [Cladochytrium replicatum]
MVAEQISNTSAPHILWFDDVGLKDIPVVGGKNASLGEMIRQLGAKGVSVPGGYATTAHAYRYYIKQTGIGPKLREILSNLDTTNVRALREAGQAARQLILETPFPLDFNEAIVQSYRQMCKRFGRTNGRTGTVDVDCAVRSSATAEDLPNASFAGQQETYLNVHGDKAILEATQKCFASLFTDRAISYRVQMGFDHFAVALSVGIQLMVRSDLAAAGVMFSIDTETGFRNAVVINGAYGLGENVVQGAVNPDEFIIFKPTLSQGFRPILDKRLGSKELKMIYDVGGGKSVKNIPVAMPDRNRFCLNDEQILTLSKWAIIIEDHYSGLHKKWTPMDMEWALDGVTNELFIVQARPETVQSQKGHNAALVQYRLSPATPDPKIHPIITQGVAVGAAVGSGRVRVLHDFRDMHSFKAGEVLVAHRTDPDWEPIMKKASAIITNLGGRTCHAAIIARELGVPAVVGTNNATEVLQNGQNITLACCLGDTGLVFSGLVPYVKDEIRIDILPKTRTKIMMNVGNPADAFALSKFPCDGVGLARLEFIIANHVKVHPLALLKWPQLKDKAAVEEIAQLTRLYPANMKSMYFIDRLASGIATIAAAFYPKPVVVRMSDFKTNEYEKLLGGSEFEPVEENPMIGWRGASRYYDPNYRQGFALECAAFVQVRQLMGLKNVIPMIPFCRTPEEGKLVLAEMSRNGLERGVDGLKVYVMCEIPSNVVLAEDFSKLFDGFSIGSNDLTQLTLGLDRDSGGAIARLFDERNPAVKAMIRSVLQLQAQGKLGKDFKIGICGQGPSDFPDFAEFLVENGIQSLSLNPDSVLKTLLRISKLEEKLNIKPAALGVSQDSLAAKAHL